MRGIDDMSFLEKLRAAHQFPGEYTFKLIGENTPTLVQCALVEIEKVLPGTEPQVSTRTSAKGNHQSLTLVFEVPDAETVQDLYQRFHALSVVRMML